MRHLEPGQPVWPVPYSRQHYEARAVVEAAAVFVPVLQGRYMAIVALSFWLGLALAPTLGTQLLSVSPSAAMLVAAGVALAAGLSALALERVLPAPTRLTPRPASPAATEAHAPGRA